MVCDTYWVDCGPTGLERLERREKLCISKNTNKPANGAGA